jgi:protoporphyrinogen oxidase
MIVIIGSGPSGIIVGNLLKKDDQDFILLTKGSGNFGTVDMEGIKYTVGQRTMFYADNMAKLFSILGFEYQVKELTHLIGVFYKGKVYPYPIQNNLSKMCVMDKVKLVWSYLNRNKKLAESENYADYIVGNYGEYLAKNIILPHTWKTIKEDLWSIKSGSYGKKVIPMKFFGDKNIEKAFDDSSDIIEQMKSNISGYINEENVLEIDMVRCNVVTESNKIIKYDHLINTIALPKLAGLIKDKGDILDLAFKSLHYNNMLVYAMLVPSTFIKYPYDIMYFPERDYIFSKVNITRGNGHSVVSVEISFRKNEEGLYHSKIFIDKLKEHIEYDLKKCGLLEPNIFTTLKDFIHVISPAYIICDDEYSMYRDIITTTLEHNHIYGVGRFSQWLPHMRVEHSLDRAIQLLENKIIGELVDWVVP